MIKMKAGGMILTGLAAFLIADKAVSSMRRAVGDVCEAAKWRGYYKCWSKGDAKGEPVPPGYSMTTRPDGANYEVVYDPNGADHSHDNDPKTEENHDSSASVKAVCEAVKAVAEKAIDSLSKRSDGLREASEGQTEASESENQASDENDIHPWENDDGNYTDGAIERAINGTFREDGNASEDSRIVLESLKGFDTKFYKLPDDAAPVDKEHGFDRKAETNAIANLITDMSNRGANSVEMQRAIKHSMVILDAEKYHLDYAQSYKDNGIEDLIKKYQTQNSDISKSWKETDQNETVD